jgi:EAL domain-containing protein (putative c-di-GMP-specific phosphodiesterase class I)/GGDEF domain-containing protein
MQREPTTESGKPRADFALRAERDRFVALAFCASDILLELDNELKIVFAAGATAALLGIQPESLFGRSFVEFVVPADRPWIGKTLESATAGERIRNLGLRLEGAFGETSMTLTGYQNPDMGHRYYIALHVPSLSASASNVPVSLAATPSGLPDGQAFAETAGARMAKLGSASDMYKLTLMRLDGLVQLEERLENETRTRLLTQVAGMMRAASLGGDSAGQLDGESFSFIHATDFDTKQLAERVRALAAALDPDGEGVNPSTALVDLDARDMNREEAAKACLYVFDRYVAAPEGELEIKSLSAGLSGLIGDTVDRVQHFRNIVRDANFNMAFQPVVDLATRQTRHFEVLARFTDPGQSNTYQVITFAERTGLICDFDLAMCTKVLTWLEAERAAGHDHRVAVNLSGRSIGSPAFVDALHRLLANYPTLRSNLLFEITESARIQDLDVVSNIVRGFREAGHRVCLDDFGAGASAFHYLRALEVDVVKIDGIYVRDALKTGKGQSFLKAMAGLCNDLGIATVAEMVESTNALAFLRACGVAYGQGYLFGRPSENIRDFTNPRAPQEIKVPTVPLNKRVAARSPLSAAKSQGKGA